MKVVDMLRFPSKHIADSVVERIMAADQKMNKVQQQGAALDQALAQPPGEVAPIEGLDEALVGRALQL